MLRRANPPFYRSPKPAPARPVGLSDGQLRQVMDAARPLEPEKRTALLERIAARHVSLLRHFIAWLNQTRNWRELSIWLGRSLLPFCALISCARSLRAFAIHRAMMQVRRPRDFVSATTQFVD